MRYSFSQGFATTSSLGYYWTVWFSQCILHILFNSVMERISILLVKWVKEDAKNYINFNNHVCCILAFFYCFSRQVQLILGSLMCQVVVTVNDMMNECLGKVNWCFKLKMSFLFLREVKLVINTNLWHFGEIGPLGNIN
jgi:hypothetical protein